MARLRKFVCYRELERPYTRYSKYSNKNFVRSKPHNRITRYVIGNLKAKYDAVFALVSKSNLQIRDNALEAARQSCNRLLDKTIGVNYRLTVRAVPHHILRENPLASGAGADRMSTGMAHCFGKNIGLAAQVYEGKVILSVELPKEHASVARAALERASHKLPGNQKVVQLA